MFSLPPVLAHGALGIWDDLIFISIIAIFLAMMGVSWFRSRTMEQPLKEKTDPAVHTDDPTDDIQPPDHFELD